METTGSVDVLAPQESPVGSDRTPAVPGRPRSLRTRRQLPVYSPVAVGALWRTALGRGLGEARQRLTRLLLREYSAERVVLCASGTEALQLAIITAWRQAGQTGSVALPAFACYDVATAAVGAGVPVDFFDVDPATLSPDLESLERVLRAGASVVVVAPLYGIPVNWDQISELCDRSGAIAIEDAAQGHGAHWRDRPLGSHGSLSVLSFGRGKGWTGGGGGALLMRGGAWSSSSEPRSVPVTSRADASTVAKLAAQWALGRPAIYGLAAGIPHLQLGRTIYHEPIAPRQMARAAAALALEHRELAATGALHRRQSGARWKQDLERIAGAAPIPVPQDGVPGYLRFPLIAAQGMAGFADLAEATSAGIAGSYPRPLPQLQPIRAQTRRPKRGWAGAELLTRTLITIPTHHQVSEWDRVRVMECLASYSPEERQP